MDDAETVLLIDSWKNQQSIDIHHESPMMEQIIRLRDKYDLTMKVERYISDEMGIPASDNKYIRN
jgi:quinol monooxygenase YgiN